MLYRLQRLALATCVAGAGLAAVVPRLRPTHDLDSYTDAQLKRDLDDELDDIYQKLGDPDGEYDLTDLKEDILAALGDDGDEGNEDDIDLADLNDEMSEAGTTLEDVVDDALAKADELSLRPQDRSWTVVLAGFAASNAQKRDKASKASVAVRETTRDIILNIRRAKS